MKRYFSQGCCETQMHSWDIKHISRWCDVALDSRNQKSNSSDLRQTDGGVPVLSLDNSKHAQIMNDLRTNQQICNFLWPSKRKCLTWSIRGGGTNSLPDFKSSRFQNENGLVQWVETKPSSKFWSESQSAGNPYVNDNGKRATTESESKSKEDITDDCICDKATPSPLHVETDADCRYRDVRMLLDLLAPDPVCHASCSSPPLHHPSRSSIGGADEELALLFKYTHVMGGPASLEEIAQATS